MAKKQNTTLAESPGYRSFNPDELLLDPENPRLVELGLSNDVPEFDIVKALWDKMAVEELAMSIAYNGYFAHEPLFIEERSVGGQSRHFVIEGNRRLAAVKILLDSSLRKRVGASDLPTISATQKNALRSLPGIVTTGKEIWRYLGFKHVNGPSTWGSYAKAQYIARVHNEYKVPIDQIAKQIGDYANTAERMYRGLMVIEQAEESDLFDRTNTAKNDFFFNYIYTALDNASYRKFIGLGDNRTKRRPVPSNRLNNLRDLCVWLYGDKSKGIPSLIKSQNPDLGRLGALLDDQKAIRALKEGHSLGAAEEIGTGDERLFRRALYEAKKALSNAHGTLTIGFDPADNDSFRIGEEIEQLSIELVEEMTAKRKSRRRTRTHTKSKTANG